MIPRFCLRMNQPVTFDPALSLEIIDLFQNIHIRGTTILMATHERSWWSVYVDVN
ncbi:MAG: hypothetical protein R2877_06320 [Bdellovibrionota bacterium]